MQISNQEQSGKSGKGIAEQDGKGLAEKDERGLANKYGKGKMTTGNVEGNGGKGLEGTNKKGQFDKQADQASSSSSNTGTVAQEQFQRIRALQTELQEAEVELRKRDSYTERAYRMYENQKAEIRQFQHLENNMKQEINWFRQEDEENVASLYAIAQNLRGCREEAQVRTGQG